MKDGKANKIIRIALFSSGILEKLKSTQREIEIRIIASKK
jgi:hypothetical protein